MYKTCSLCGGIHPYGESCKRKRIYKNTEERELRHQWSWTKKAKEIKERSNYLCEYCKSKNIFTYENLETHHIKKLAHHPELLLEDSNLICLCTTCHKLADDGKISEEVLSELARQRDEGMGK